MIVHKKIITSGFTMIEMLLSISIITIILGISAPVYQSLQTKNDLDVAAITVAQTLRRAQTLAQSGDGDSLWGVKVSNGNITLFQGSNYTSRNTNFDEVYEDSAGITASGLTEVSFDKLTGYPDSTGNITLTSSDNEIRTITINEKGTISY